MKKNKHATSVPVELQSLIETHQHPFVVIDRDYRIMAVNSAYEKCYGTTRKHAVGKPCYVISHHNDRPCHENGEDCPHANLFEIGTTDACIHHHYDCDDRKCQVRVTAYPLHGSDGELYMGELIEQLQSPEDRRNHGVRMVGNNEQFLACLEQLRIAAASHVQVLLQGETGTGKELAANYLHNHSPRKDKPFLTIDCTVLTETLFESEMFGHAKGAFTGSVGEKDGVLHEAHGGTLFLDEIGELSASLQAKLLRVLETGQYRRVGDQGYRTVDVRLVCATNRHLWETVVAGHFREDLYYRIACMTIQLPPLRKRLDDIPTLARNLLEPIKGVLHQRFTITPGAIELLKSYPYPGNVRELRNFLFVAATHCTDGEISKTLISRVMEQHQHNREQFTETVTEETRQVPVAGPDVASLHDMEAQHIAGLLDRFDGERKLVAATLGVSVRTLYRKLRRYGLN